MMHPTPVLLSYVGLPAHGLRVLPLPGPSLSFTCLQGTLFTVFAVSAIFRYVVSVATPESVPLIKTSIAQCRCGPILVHASNPLAFYSFSATSQFRGYVSGPLPSLSVGVYVLAGWILSQLSDFGQASVC